MAGRKKGKTPATEPFPALRGSTQPSLPGAEAPPPASSARASSAAPAGPPTPSTITLEVDRKKPRLAWQGMFRKEDA